MIRGGLAPRQCEQRAPAIGPGVHMPVRLDCRPVRGIVVVAAPYCCSRSKATERFGLISQ